jgi:N-acylneuraminate cytidylyltransferase
MKNSVAIIPARGGSKRIPRKNIKAFKGKPMISYSIESLVESNLFDDIFVSTEDDEIAEIARQFGASVPFKRSNHLAGDNVITVPVIADFVKRIGLPEDTVVCCMYATAPLVRSQDLISAYRELFKEPKADYVCAVTKYGYPIQRSLRKTKNFYEMVDLSSLKRLSQEFEERYHDAGQFYFAHAKTWVEERNMLINTRGIELPSWRVQDIDTPEDWDRAEILYEIIKSRN